MRKKALISYLAALSLILSSFSAQSTVSAEAVKADVDPLVYKAATIILPEWDEDSDGIISEEEFSHIRYLNLTGVTDETDLSCLKKAVSLKHLDISNSTRSDYSVLSDLTWLKTIVFSYVPVSDLSFTDSMDLNYLMLTETEVSTEEKLKYVKFPDIEIPAGYYDMFALSPACTLDCSFEIEDDSIAGFEAKGESSTKEMYYNHIYAKSEGETKYNAILDGEVIGSGKIKVVPADIFDPPLETEGPEVVKVQKCGWTDDITYNSDLNILLSDGRVFKYQKGKYTLTAEDAADISSTEHYSGRVINVQTGEVQEASRTFDNFILFKDGRLTLNGEDVFEEDIKVCSLCGNYVITENGDLWYIDTNNGVSPLKVGTNYSYFRDSSFALKKNKTAVLLKRSKDDYGKTRISEISVGQFSVKSIIKSYNYYILETNGNFWLVDYQKGKSTLISKNTAEAGFSEENGILRRDIIYITEDGKAYYADNKTETSAAVEHIMHEEYDYDFNPYSELIDSYSPHGFPLNVTVNGVKNEGDDRYVAESTEKDGTVYFSCFKDHMAVTEVKEIIGDYYDGEDAVVHFIRNDNTLWEYNISKRKFIKADFPEYTAPDEEKYTVSDLVNAVNYFLGNEDSSMRDYNGDGKINIADIIYLKSLLLS